MTRDTLLRILRKYGACRDAFAWVEETPGTVAELWSTCNRADRMLWLAGQCIDRRTLVLTTCACVRAALPYARGATAQVTIETAEAWCRGEVTLDQVRDAADAACAATYAARAATFAPDSYAAEAAEAAANAAAYAAAAAEATAAALSRMADIVREHITASEIIAALEAHNKEARP